jgi:hypothetical protein
MFLKTNQVRMSLMPDEAMLERYQSYSKRVQFLELPSRILYAHQFQSNYLPTKRRVQELFNIINNVSEEFKNKPVSNVFPFTMLIFTK